MPFRAIHRTAILLLVLALPLQAAAAACPAPEPKAQLWYEDNNLGRAGGMPADFTGKFTAPAWQRAAHAIDVYLIRLNVLEQMDDKFLTDTLRPFLKNHRLAVDAGGATWLHYGKRRVAFENDLRQLRRLRKLGITVSDISLQSPLSKPLPGTAYPLQERLLDVALYSAAARQIYPSARIGIIDALPAHGGDWREAYGDLIATGAVDYIHLDMPWELIGKKVSWEELRRIEHFVEDQGLDFGLLLTTRRGGEHSEKAYARGVEAELTGYQHHCGSPAAYVIASWFPHPARTVPTVTDLITRIAHNLARDAQPAN